MKVFALVICLCLYHKCRLVMQCNIKRFERNIQLLKENEFLINTINSLNKDIKVYKDLKIY